MQIKDFFNKHQVLKKISLGLSLFILIWIAYDLFYYLGRTPHDDYQTIRTGMVIIVLLCLIGIAYLKGKDKLTITSFLNLLLIIGFTMRIGYALYTGASLRQHDVEMYSNKELNYDGQGHFSYIYTIYSTGKLPQEIRWQFYHPPLWHAIVAGFMHVYSFIENTKDVAILFNAGMIVSSFVGCLSLYALKEIILYLTKNKYIIAISMIILSLHPQFFIMSGWMNNEGLAFMFVTFTILYAIKFHKERRWSDIILCGIMLGLGAMSKVSVATICVPLAVVFITDFVIDVKAKKNKRIILQGLTFLGIVIPLAMWFLLRNYIRFGVSSLTVPGVNNSSMSVSGYTFLERFVLIPFHKLNESMFCILRLNNNKYLDYNVWLYTFKCSVFGEYNYWGGDFFGAIMLVFNILLIFLSLYAMVYILIKERKSSDRFMNIVMLVIYGISLLSYIGFQLLYPVTCTQDFRYMTIILLPGAYFTARYYGYLVDNNKKIMKIVTLFLVICFAFSCFAYYVSAR